MRPQAHLDDFTSSLALSLVQLLGHRVVSLNEELDAVVHSGHRTASLIDRRWSMWCLSLSVACAATVSSAWRPWCGDGANRCPVRAPGSTASSRHRGWGNGDGSHCSVPWLAGTGPMVLPIG